MSTYASILARSSGLSFHLCHVFLPRCSCYVVRGRALGIHPGGATHFSALWHCMWGGEVREGTMSLAQLSAGFQSLPLLPTSKLGPSGADS